MSDGPKSTRRLDEVESANLEADVVDLGDGLVLRASTPDDRGALATFFGDVFPGPNETEPAGWLITWTKDLMSGQHPIVAPSDFTVVIDTGTGAIVSGCGFIPQVWRYEGIEFGVGQPEIVATHKDYRRRGLVRKQFDMLHRWSAERGHLVTAINGIPFYYRQFGYDMALDKGGGRTGSLAGIGALKEGEAEPYAIREATTDDIPLFMKTYEQSARRSMISCVRDEAMWDYDFSVRTEGQRQAHRVIEDESGEPVGTIIYGRGSYRHMSIESYEVLPGVPWSDVTPSVLRWIKAECEANAANDPNGDAVEARTSFGMHFGLLPTHPVFDLIGDMLPGHQRQYAWYMRVPDVSAFLNHIALVLSRRLAESAVAGFSGEIKVGWFVDGVRVLFEGGRVSAEPWSPTVDDTGHAHFPYLTFLQLLFGYRSLDELKYAYADCNADANTNRDKSVDAGVLLSALFPKRPSLVWNVT